MPLDQALFDAGLKLQAAIPIKEVAVPLPDIAGSFTQLIVLAHAGPDYFDQMEITGDHPFLPARWLSSVFIAHQEQHATRGEGKRLREPIIPEAYLYNKTPKI